MFSQYIDIKYFEQSYTVTILRNARPEDYVQNVSSFYEIDIDLTLEAYETKDYLQFRGRSMKLQVQVSWVDRE